MSKNNIRIISVLVSFLAIVTVVIVFKYYRAYIAPNVTGKHTYLYIHTGANFDDLLSTIKREGLLENTASFVDLAKRMSYLEKIKPGKYRLQEGMSNRKLINMLKSGNQEPVQLSFRNIRLKEDFAGVIAGQLEADSLSIIHLLDSSAFIGKYGFNKENVYTMFIPNSYELYWNTPAEKFFKRMYEEYQEFWNEERCTKAEKIGLNQIQVSILASIVAGETMYEKEMPMVAGLYMNRYKQGIALEADPTVIFANNDFTIRRVLNKHLRTDSPYNTYMYVGLPPGPINMPSIKAIDAVLNYTKHSFIYMCAKDDFSGYHNFAANLEAHKENARKFHEALNERNIKK